MVSCEDSTLEIFVLAPGELGMAAGTDLQQVVDAALEFELAGGGGGAAREDLE
jgi:hypothetical protein